MKWLLVFTLVANFALVVVWFFHISSLSPYLKPAINRSWFLFSPIWLFKPSWFLPGADRRLNSARIAIAIAWVCFTVPAVYLVKVGQ